MNLITNLGNYKDEKLKEQNISEKTYMTYSDFQPSVIFGFAFGADYEEKSINDTLAQSVIDARKIFDTGLTAIVQNEIGTCLQRRDAGNFYSVGQNYKDDETAVLLSNIDSYKIFEMCLDKMQRKSIDINSILYIAHPAHMQRIMDIGNKLNAKGAPFITKEINWSADDKQQWVHSAYLWIPRELMTRVYCKLKGTI